MSDTVEVAAGATRSEIAPAYHLVPPEGPRRIAIRYGLGAKQHGAWNWKNAAKDEASAREWCDQVYNHMLEHMQKMAHNLEPEDDHIGAIGWGVTQLAWFEAHFNKKWTELTVQTAPAEASLSPFQQVLDWVERGHSQTPGPACPYGYDLSTLEGALNMLENSRLSNEQLNRWNQLRNEVMARRLRRERNVQC